MLDDEKKRRHAFYEWLQDDVKAEFINGEVIMHSPVKRRHLRANGNLTTLLRIYVQAHDLGEVDTEKALITLTRNDYEPDICFWRKEVADTFDDDTLSALTVSGFSIPVRAIFENDANRDALQALLS
jgi:Uma2 family endonuclease